MAIFWPTPGFKGRTFALSGSQCMGLLFSASSVPHCSEAVERICGANYTERAVVTEIDSEKRTKGVGKLGWFVSKDRNRKVHTTRVDILRSLWPWDLTYSVMAGLKLERELEAFHKFQVPGLSYNWWGFQAWDALQDSIDNSSTDNVETSLEWQEYFSQLQGTTDARPCYIHLPVCLWIMDPHSRVPKKNTNHGNEVLPQDTTHLIQRPCYQRRSPCQDPAGSRTSRRPPDHCKKTQTAMVWSCLPFIRSG